MGCCYPITYEEEHVYLIEDTLIGIYRRLITDITITHAELEVDQWTRWLICLHENGMRVSKVGLNLLLISMAICIALEFQKLPAPES